MWNLYVDHSSSAMGHICCDVGGICSGAYASNVKCMYISLPDHIADCIGFI